MPPKGNKRTAVATAKVKEDTKKQRTMYDPKLAPVTAAISKADGLPQKCRDMLISILADSVKVEVENERHSIQNAALEMIEETLEKEKSLIQKQVSESEEKVAALTSIQVEKDGEHLASVEELAKCMQQEKTRKASLAEASTAKREADKALTEAMAKKITGGKTFETNKEEKAVLEKAFEEHYKTPMATEEKIHFAALEPFLGKLTLDDSLKKALPSTCVKTKEQRGSFDEVVLDELHKAFTTKIEELTVAVDTEGPAAAEREATAQAAEADLEGKKAALKDAMAVYSEAEKSRKAVEQQVAEALKVAKNAGKDADVEKKACEALKEQLSEFEAGPLATFASLKDPPKEVEPTPMETVEAAEDVATAGA